MAFGRQNRLGVSYTPIERESIGTMFKGLSDAVEMSEKMKEDASKQALRDIQGQLASTRINEIEAEKARRVGEATDTIERQPRYERDASGNLVESTEVPSMFGDNLLEGLTPAQQSEFLGRTESEAKSIGDNIKAFGEQQKAKQKAKDDMARTVAGKTPKAEKTIRVYDVNDPDKSFSVPESQANKYTGTGKYSATKPSAEKDVFAQREKEAGERAKTIDRIKTKIDKGTWFSDELTDEQATLVDDALAGMAKNLKKNDLEKLATLSDEQLFNTVNDYLLETKGGKLERDALSSILPFGDKGFKFNYDKEALARIANKNLKGK